MHTNIEKIFTKTIKNILEKAPFQVDLAVILGSGLGDFASSLSPELSLKVSEIQDYPVSTVQGHSGMLHFVEYKGLRILLFQGRIHFYEGYSLKQCLLPVEIAKQLGAKNVIITNAAGGINSLFCPGDLMLTSGFVSLFLKKEISQVLGAGKIDQRNELIELGSSDLYRFVKNAAIETSTNIREGVYFYSKGPSYETPAEIRFMRTFGADAVGMSSVHEAIYSIYRGISPVMISCITNFAAGITSSKLSHSEVTETADLVKTKFENLLKSTFDQIIAQK